MRRGVRLGAGGAAVGAVLALSACGGASPLTLGKDRNPPDARAADTPTGQGAAQEGSADALDGLSAPEIAELSFERLQQVDALRVAGWLRFNEGGQQEIDFEVHLDRAGDCTGEFGTPHDGSFEVIKSGEKVWLKPDAQLWRDIGGPEGEEMAESMVGMYVYGTLDEPEVAEFAEVCSLDEFTAPFEPGGGTQEMTMGPKTTHGSVPVVSLHDRSAGPDMTLLVAAEGEPYPLSVSGTSGSDRIDVDFSDFDQPVTAEEPPAHLVVDMAFSTGDLQI